MTDKWHTKYIRRDATRASKRRYLFHRVLTVTHPSRSVSCCNEYLGGSLTVEICCHLIRGFVLYHLVTMRDPISILKVLFLIPLPNLFTTRAHPNNSLLKSSSRKQVFQENTSSSCGSTIVSSCTRMFSIVFGTCLGGACNKHKDRSERSFSLEKWRKKEWVPVIKYGSSLLWVGFHNV